MTILTLEEFRNSVEKNALPKQDIGLAEKKKSFKLKLVSAVTPKALKAGLSLSVTTGPDESPVEIKLSRENESFALDLNLFLEKRLSVEKMINLSESELKTTIEDLSTRIVNEIKELFQFKSISSKNASMLEVFGKKFMDFSKLRLVVRNENQKKEYVSKKIRGTDLKVFLVSVCKEESTSGFRTAFLKDEEGTINSLFKSIKNKNCLDHYIKDKDYDSLTFEEKKDFLFSIALKNTKAPVGIEMPNVFLSSALNLELKECYSPESFMITFLNNDEIMGKGNSATLFIFEEKLKEIFNKLNRDFFILPSSIHELIVVPNKKKTLSLEQQSKQLLEIVKEVNSTLDPKDVLSNSIYHFDGEKIKMF